MATGDLSRIRTNIGALNALNALEDINAQLTQSQLRLATGKRINSAGDDPAGLTLANTLDLRARRVAMAERNVGDASNVLSIVDGGLQNINDLLSSIAEKLTLAANDTQGTSQRNAIMTEIQQLGQEVDSVVNQTQFNGITLLTVNTMTFQVGPDGTNTNVFSIGQALNSAALLVTQLTVATQALASASLGTVQIAINSLAAIIQSTGSSIERLNVRADNLSTAELNLRAAQSRIMDADLAAEQMNSSKLQILQQTATSALAAANTAPASLLALFR
jgi:flagellin